MTGSVSARVRAWLPVLKAAGGRPIRAPAPATWQFSARMRILGWSVLFMAVALGASTLVVHLVLMRRVEVGIDVELSHEADEFHALMSSRAASGEPLATSTMALLRAAAARTVPEANVTFVGLLNGHPSFLSPAVPLADPAADRTAVAGWAATTRTTIGDGHSAAGPTRYLAVPFHVAGDPTKGVFVTVVFTAPDRAAVWQVTRTQITIEALALFVATLLGWAVAGRVLRPVRQTTELARRITETDLAERIPVRGRDEISNLATTMAAMLDRLQAGLTAHRDLLADAGHELRTPITIVQGNLDTLAADDPDDIESLAIATEELQRMSRMVDDLLMLARAEQPDFLQCKPVEIGTLTLAMVSELDSLGTIRWHVGGIASGWCVIDSQRIAQAIVELGANALTHNADSAGLEFATRWVSDDLVLTVADRGPGIPNAKRSRIFDRFARVDHRRTSGTGLGLSIVAAICHAHGGRVSVADREPPPGAVFTIRIPRRKPTQAVHPTARARTAQSTTARAL